MPEEPVAVAELAAGVEQAAEAGPDQAEQPEAAVATVEPPPVPGAAQVLPPVRELQGAATAADLLPALTAAETEQVLMGLGPGRDGAQLRVLEPEVARERGPA